MKSLNLEEENLICFFINKGGKKKYKFEGN